ncbi:MAG: AAA family ATPase [Tissierella sp.]|uniref:AAA family ATPase n=1 Tax=Tissierella sp. TaxID=41274 RepID=UPI003F9A8F38
MQKESFERWLKNIKAYSKDTVTTISRNCKLIEDTYGDLDELYKKDRLKSIKEELNTDNHRIPIDGNRDNGTATYKSALKLYLEFKENDLLEKIMSMDDIDPDKHDGSYELIRETVESLSKSNINDLGVKDLNMLYSMAVGTWRMDLDVKFKRIEDSNLIDKEKIRMKSVLEKIQENAENRQYENREKDEDSIGMFGTGFWTFKKNTSSEEARKFISLMIEIKDLKDEDKIFNILEDGFKNGISGIQTGSASMILHCLKPNIFPILNGMVAKSIVVLEGMGIVLNKATLLTHYIENTKKLKKFRDTYCKFKNYRTLDKALQNMDAGKTGTRTISSKRLDAVIDAFNLIGKKGKIKDIFDYVKADPRFEYEKFSSKSSAEGTIRLIIQEHSSDTQIYKEDNEDLFYSVDGIGKGMWALRSFEPKVQLSIDFSKALDFENLHFTNPEVLKNQISIALKSGKSIILIGPPGTGKSKIAKVISKSYGADSKMVTAMSDWSSYDTIGGYKPTAEGDLYFEEGIFLSSFKSKEGKNINSWLIIDEINRADIDKAFGPFFSALSGDDVELGLRDSKGENIEITLEENLEDVGEDLESRDNQYIIPKDWRIIGTMNTFDKTSLYEMSYAFMRRFAFIPVAIPKDIDGSLVEKFFKLWNINLDFNGCENISDLWEVINKYRKIGPAIVEDIGNFIVNGGDYTSAISIYILPQLEGLFTEDIILFIEGLKELKFIEDETRLIESIEDFFNISLAGK